MEYLHNARSILGRATHLFGESYPSSRARATRTKAFLQDKPCPALRGERFGTCALLSDQGLQDPAIRSVVNRVAPAGILMTLVRRHEQVLQPHIWIRSLRRIAHSNPRCPKIMSPGPTGAEILIDLAMIRINQNAPIVKPYTSRPGGEQEKITRAHRFGSPACKKPEVHRASRRAPSQSLRSSLGSEPYGYTRQPCRPSIYRTALLA